MVITSATTNGKICSVKSDIDKRMLIKEEINELSLDYAKQRVTFGKPIASRESIRTLLADRAMVIHGGRSYLQSWPIERLMREERLNVLEEGTPSIQRMVTDRALLSGDLPWSPPW